MAKIVQIDKLYDIYYRMIFGYVGVDLETGEIKYYSFYDNDNYNPGMLYEFDINNVKGKYLTGHMKYCYYQREGYLPRQVKNQVDEIIDSHKNYNMKNGYPTTDLDFNKNNLSVKCINILNIFGNSINVGALNISGGYIPVSNIINLKTIGYDCEYIPPNVKLQQTRVLVHEVGHMKVTRCVLDERCNKLLVKTGFYDSEAELRPCLLQNGDVFYILQNVPNLDINKEGRALEELINDVDCSIAFPSYNGSYPKIGNQLNKLCDGKLLMARYENGLDTYYSSLTSIINSENLAIELLGHLSESVYGSEPKSSEEKAMKLIKKYQNAKFK